MSAILISLVKYFFRKLEELSPREYTSWIIFKCVAAVKTRKRI